MTVQAPTARRAARIWLARRRHPRTLADHRRRAVRTAARRYAKHGQAEGVWRGSGAAHTHAVADASFFAMCGQPVSHIRAGAARDITCMTCRKLHSRAARMARFIEADAPATDPQEV